jgi:hypothetical protein
MENIVMGLIYRPNTEPRAELFNLMDIINTENELCVILDDMNIIDLLKFGSRTKTSDYLDTIFFI